MTDLNKLADSLENIAHMEYPSAHHDGNNLREAARILRAAGAADVQGLMAKAMLLVSAVDESCNKVSSVPFAEAVADLEAALRVALAPKAEPQPNTTGGAFFKQCTAFTAPAAQPGAQEPKP